MCGVIFTPGDHAAGDQQGGDEDSDQTQMRSFPPMVYQNTGKNRQIVGSAFEESGVRIGSVIDHQPF